jgi:hypothetical protein
MRIQAAMLKSAPGWNNRRIPTAFAAISKAETVGQGAAWGEKAD